MSSTNKTVRKDEYYITPAWLVDEMLDFVDSCSCYVSLYLHRLFTAGGVILDPCAGGELQMQVAFPVAPDGIHRHPAYPARYKDRYSTQLDYLGETDGQPSQCITVDIREDSPALFKADFVLDDLPFPHGSIDAVGSNPPFSLATEFVRVALKLVQPGGVVFMLQRLNFLGSLKRIPFWSDHPPALILTHPKRAAFDPESTGTDSIEYAHFFWVRDRKLTRRPEIISAADFYG